MTDHKKTKTATNPNKVVLKWPIAIYWEVVGSVCFAQEAQLCCCAALPKQESGIFPDSNGGREAQKDKNEYGACRCMTTLKQLIKFWRRFEGLPFYYLDIDTNAHVVPANDP